MSENTTIRVGSRVYMRNCVAGDPGCVVGFERSRAVVHWPDMPEQRDTRHSPDSLVIDTAFVVSQKEFDFGEMAA
jgi:hypothetical protein